MISHFVDHLPYYRLETIAARSGAHTPRSTLTQWSARGAALEPLYELHKVGRACRQTVCYRVNSKRVDARGA